MRGGARDGRGRARKLGLKEGSTLMLHPKVVTGRKKKDENPKGPERAG